MSVEICRSCSTHPRLSYEQTEYKLMCECGMCFCDASLSRVLIGWNITQRKEKDLNHPVIPAMLETQQ